MRKIWIIVAVGGLTGLAWLAVGALRSDPAGGQAGKGARPAPVEVAAVALAPIELRRTYSGTLQAAAKFVVAPKVGGRVDRLLLDVADPVKRGQLVAGIDDAELKQAVTQAEADLAVAKANLAEADSALRISQRELDRVAGLRERGVASGSQLDIAEANHLTKGAAVQVARARVTRAEASLAAARIRLGYTTVHATWRGGDGDRVVAERFVDEGDTVTANTPLLSIVELAPITAVVFASERDYGKLRVGQLATLTTDAFPNRQFQGSIARISPVFSQASRQARVELSLPNEDHELKPGMFVRASVVLERVEEAVLVPHAALVKRQDQYGVFVLDAAGERALWRPVTVGIQEGPLVQVIGDGVSGRAVTLGQQLIADGSRISVPETPARKVAEDDDR